MTKRVYGRRIGSSDMMSAQPMNNTPLDNGISNDLILRMVKNTPDNEKQLRGAY